MAKMLSFSQQRPRVVCILSGRGTVSSVTLRQPATSVPTVTYEVEALCLYLFLFWKKKNSPKKFSFLYFTISLPFASSMIVLVHNVEYEGIACFVFDQ